MPWLQNVDDNVVDEVLLHESKLKIGPLTELWQRKEQWNKYQNKPLWVAFNPSIVGCAYSTNNLLTNKAIAHTQSKNRKTARACILINYAIFIY